MIQSLPRVADCYATTTQCARRCGSERASGSIIDGSGQVGAIAGRPAHDHWMNSPSSGRIQPTIRCDELHLCRSIHRHADCRPERSFFLARSDRAPIGCLVGGYLSVSLGSARVAFAQLAASGLCCLASPLLFNATPALFIGFLLFWGIVVAGDSPQFSALNASSAPPEQVGSALTIANCIGFGISIVSIQLLNLTASLVPTPYLFLMLVPGPVVGILALRPLLARNLE
jgi:hypothetical protein